MRDIVNSNDFSASTLQTKSKVANMSSNSSGTLTRADYRSYRDFLESYGDNKNSKDDQESVSSTESGISSYNLSESKSNNTSTSSLNSETNGTSSKILPKTEQNTGVASRTGSFRNYLENYNHKKFSSVKPVAAGKQNIIKSEIVIQVNDPLEQQKNSGRNEPDAVFVTTINGDEQEENPIFPPPPNFMPPPTPPQLLNGHQDDGTFIPPPPPPEASKNGHQNAGGFLPPLPPPPPPQLPDFSKPTEKKWGTVQVDDHRPNSNPNQPEKRPANLAAATNLAKILTQHLLPRRKELESQPNVVIEQVSVKSIPSPPPNKVRNGQNVLLSPPPVPKFSQNDHNIIKNGQNFLRSPPPAPKFSQNGPSVVKNGQNFLRSPPPAPKFSQNGPSIVQNGQNFLRPPPPAPKLSQNVENVDEPQNYTCLISYNPPPKFLVNSAIQKQSQKAPTEMAPPKLPMSPPPKFKHSTFPRQTKKITMEIAAPKLPQSPPPKLPQSPPPNLPQSPPPKLPQSPPPKLPQSPTPKLHRLSPPKLPQSPPPKVETYYIPKQPQKMITVELSAPKLYQSLPRKTLSGRNSPNDSVDFNTTTVVPVNDTTTKVSKDDPNVRKLVYNTYRGLLGAYNNKANDMIATLPRSRVREDQGVSKQLESIAQASSSAPGAVGHIPSSRPAAGIPGRTVEPPLCVQNAMLTKDKKPFTYTPGGIDLSEIRSPRMARRLELNAMNEGVAPLPQNQNPHHPSGPLPPSALAAMNPQIQVQVLPAGGIPQPHHHGGHGGGPPPPPPPPSGVPPPPPKAPPMRSTTPVPLDSFERPDMTKIIPENPMALLRKTSGPVIKRDPIFNKQNFGGVANDVVDFAPPRQPQPVRQPESPQTKTSTSGLGSIYVPPVNQSAAPPTPPNRQPQSPPFANQRESSPSAARAPPAYYKRQPSLPQIEPQLPPNVVQRQPSAASTPPLRDPQTPESPKATLSKAPTPWLSQKRQQQQPEMPEWATNDRGRNSPVVQEPPKSQIQQESQQRPWQQQQQQQAPPWRQQQQPQQPQPQQQQLPQEPQSPPWQQRQQKQPDLQPWQQRQQQQPEPQPWQQQQQQQQQQRQPQSPPWQQQQTQSPPIQIPQGGGVRKQINVRDRPQESGPTERTEVVIVNEPPQVFHHPGPTTRIIIRQAQPQQNNSQQQLQRADSQGARIIPVQREGASSNGHAHKFSSPGATPTTPGSNSDARSLNRQLSWNSNPTQSNTFRVLQKITNTDGDDDEDQPVIEHSPKMPQHFPQRQLSTEQVRKLKQNEGDQELMNKFKQEIHINDYYEYPRYRGGHIPSKLFWMLDDSGLDQDSSLHNEVDPRYRGPHIPSKAFKLLQSMTGGPDEPPISSTVPQGQQNNNRGPKVRTIPIQIEGDGPTKTYVPPSEQTVAEPKKYMGSSIPGRSFKILQAMTGPDDCANPAQACENNENYPNDPSSYTQWGFDPNYPPPSPYYFDPYWGYYSQNYPGPNNEYPNSTQNNNSRMTPIPPSWGYYPPGYGQNNTSSENSDSSTTITEPTKKRSTSSRTTPIPWSNDNEPAKKQNGNPRCTPVPFWPYYYPNYSYENAPAEENQEAQAADGNGNKAAGEEQQNYQQYQPYWDPYYYSYYYGAPPPMYPPVYSPYPFYHPPQADAEEVSGYSSNDEMAYYGARFASMQPYSNARPQTAATPSLQKQLLQEITQAAKKLEEKRKSREEKQKVVEKIKIQSEPFEDDSSVAETSDSDTEMIGYEVCRPPFGLQAKRSVSDIKVYDAEESSHCSDEEEDEEEREEEGEEEGEEESENTTEENDDTSSVYVVDENIPHQLSVIFEESERTDSSARHIRESSVATTISEDTATIENSEDEEEGGESDGTVLVKLPLTFKFSVAERQNVTTLVVGNSEVKPQVAVKSGNKELSEKLDTRLETKSGSEENLLKVDRSIIRQVSSDSYQTAESDGETFYNTQSAGSKSNSTKFSKEKEEVRYYESEEDNIDWWGQMGKRSSTEFVEQNISKNKYKQAEVNLDEDSENDTLKQDIKITGKSDEQSIDLRPNSTSSEEDYWASSKKEDYYEKTPNVKTGGISSNVHYKEMNDEGTQIIKDTNEAEVVNDLNVQEGMEKVEAVLTSIISTINSRTSPSCSEDDKSEEVDFWAQIMNSPEKPQNDDVFVNDIPSHEEKVPLEQDVDTSSACSRNSSLSESKVSNGEENVITEIFNGLESENGEHETEDKFSNEAHVKTEEEVEETEEKLNNGSIVDKNEAITCDSEPDLKPLSVQERIKALQGSASSKHNQQPEEETEIKISVKERISALEDGNGLLNVERTVHKRKSISRKSSIKSYEEYSEEEEGDSGVTSDVSRHISETDTEPEFLELKKLSKYQRASTHSRLFKLLQDECDTEDDPEDSKEETSQTERMQSRREHLNLPLQKNGSDPESFSSSGFTSPGSPTINDRLVNELIQNLLKRKQGRIFKHMTMEKVQAAALRILQEDMDGLETLSSSEDGGSFLSPKKPGTGSSTPAKTPQEFCANFNEYNQYYDSWAEAERLYEAQYDVLPSKAFRLLQEHAATNRTGAVSGLLARCPRVLSNKNIQKELMKLMESHESPSPSPEPPEQPPDASEATNAS